MSPNRPGIVLVFANKGLSLVGAKDFHKGSMGMFALFLQHGLVLRGGGLMLGVKNICKTLGVNLRLKVTLENFPLSFILKVCKQANIALALSSEFTHAVRGCARGGGGTGNKCDDILQGVATRFGKTAFVIISQSITRIFSSCVSQ